MRVHVVTAAIGARKNTACCEQAFFFNQSSCLPNTLQSYYLEYHKRRNFRSAHQAAVLPLIKMHGDLCIRA